MTCWKNRKTSSVTVYVVCARVCAWRPYSSLSRKKGYWVGSNYFCHKVHRSVEDIYGCLGSVIFDRPTTCCMNHFGFSIGSYPPESLRLRLLIIVGDKRKQGRGGGNYKLPPVHNGPITTCVQLACAQQYIAGSLPYDIMTKYGISKKSVSESVWAVVKAVNNLHLWGTITQNDWQE